MNDLFERIKFFLSETLPPRRQAELAKALEGNGARRANTISSATHYITNSNPNPPIELENVEIVSDYWVDRAMVLGSIPPSEFYSVEPGKIFSGIVGCASGISVADQTMIEAGITSLGGQWRHGLSKDVTHLFATNPDSDRYAAAMELRKNSEDHTHLMKVLLPHWFDDAFRIGSGKLPTTAYEWPDPKVLHPMSSLEELQSERATTRKLSTVKHMFLKTAVWNSEKVTPFPGPAAPLGNIWNGRKILLSLTLGLDKQRRQVVEAAVEQAGGLIVEIDDEDEENEGVVDCDVFITRWRAGEAFITAFNQTKTIGTLNWLLFVHATGTVSNPLDQLPHYPVRKNPPLHDTQHLITVTNYTGPAREYLKRLINLLGWKFSPGMSGQNTVIIAAHMGGEKTQRAMAWEIPVVNHMWLEDCFAGWKAITPALSKYIEFPPNVDFAPMLAERALDVSPDALSSEEDEDRDGRPPVGTEASAKEVESLLEDMDTTPSNPRRKSSRVVVPPSVSPMKNRSGDDEEMIVDELPELPSAPQRVETKKILSAKSRGKQPDRSAEDSKKSSERRNTQHAEDVEASEMETSPTTQHNRKGKAKEKPTKTPNKVTFAEDSAGPSNSRPSKKKPTATAAPAPKRKVQAMESVSDDEATDEVPSEDEPPKKRAKKKSIPSTANPAPKRKLPVTDAASDDETAHESESDDEPPKKRAKVNKTTTATVAATTTTASSSKRKMTAGPGKDSAPRQPERTESVNALAEERANVSKTGSKRKQPEASSSAAGAKSKKKSSRVEEDDAEMLSDVGNRTLDERAQRERGSSGKKSADVIDVDDVAPPKTTKAKVPETTKKATKKSKGAANTSGESRKSAGPVKLLTTGMVLPDNVLKTLSKLGVTTASNGSDCTHLVAQNLIRTEKLLCALASGAFILSDKWAIESAEANKLLPESNYILRDKTNEKKWNFRLADAIERVKEVRGKLFEGKTFYVTSKVSIDRKLLKTVVGAQGGKVMTSNPTIRVLNSAPYRYVISCPEDVSLWRSLSKQQHTIYSQELLLSAALTQQIDWKNPEFQLKADDDTA